MPWPIQTDYDMQLSSCGVGWRLTRSLLTREFNEETVPLELLPEVPEEVLAEGVGKVAEFEAKGLVKEEVKVVVNVVEARVTVEEIKVKALVILVGFVCEEGPESDSVYGQVV